MGLYEILVKAGAEKDITRLPYDVVPRILKKIEALSETPIPHGARKVSGTESLYRIRAGDYRIIYEVSHERRQITIVYVRHRHSAYRRL
ncbi:type II toxin-antitoxin system RelE/ParE family toxin [Methanofollis formosanus]|uniref:Type II toxin-antitoxin system RelE/ParE family toxin n=1 Tax=Methanofollis formosanus TaxID=299308 RepID=A0A8G1EHS0_9EURY|nr:type II toxin-antitoxin system RelE/ParE family toxin [Methanofollis formosanus]